MKGRKSITLSTLLAIEQFLMGAEEPVGITHIRDTLHIDLNSVKIALKYLIREGKVKAKGSYYCGVKNLSGILED